MVKKYYLETNALYSIRKIKDELIPECYTSLWSIFEIISGISEDNFLKRKALIGLIRYRKLEVDWRMPQEMLFQSFEALHQNFEFRDYRHDAILRLYQNLEKSSSMAEFLAMDELERPKMGLSFFREQDDKYSASYVTASINGNRQIEEILRNEPADSVTVDGTTYKLDSRKSIGEFLMNEFHVNRSYTIVSFAEMFYGGEVKSSGIDVEMIYESYNGYVDKCINAHTFYGTELMTNRIQPRKNDFSDLMHIVYLSDSPDTMLVSDDKIFQIVCPQLLCSVSFLKA